MVFVFPESGLLLPDFLPDNGRVFFLPDRGLPVLPPDNGLADWAIFEHLRAAETKSDFFDQGYPDRNERTISVTGIDVWADTRTDILIVRTGTRTVRTTVSWTCNNLATERRGFFRQFDHDVSKLFASYLFVSVRFSVQIMFGSVRLRSAARENAFYFSFFIFSLKVRNLGRCVSDLTSWSEYIQIQLV